MPRREVQGTAGRESGVRRSTAKPHTRAALASSRSAVSPVQRKWTRTASLDGPAPLSSADLLRLPGLIVENVLKKDGVHAGGRIIGRLDPPTKCPRCGQALRSKGRINTPLIIRHTPVLDGPTVLEIWRGRSECTACKESFTPRPDWIHPTRQMTCALVDQILVDALNDKHVPFSEQARRKGVARRQVGEIRDHVVRQVPQIPHFQPEVLLIDNTHPLGYQRGDGATAFMAARIKAGEPNRLLMVVDGKEEATIVQALQAIAQWPKVGRGVRWVVCDADSDIIKAVREVFPEAKLIIDLWHRVRDFTRGMDRVRVDVQKDLDKKRAAL